MYESSNTKKIQTGGRINNAIIDEEKKSSGGTPVPEVYKSKRRRSIVGAIAVGAAAATLAAGLLISSNQNNSGNHGVKPPEATKSSEPLDTSKKPESAPVYEAVPIPLGATSIEIGVAITKITNNEYNGNLTQATYDAILNDNTGASFDDLGNAIATKNIKAIMDAQYIPDWNNDKGLISFSNHLIEKNALLIHNYTAGQTLKDNFTFDSATPVSTDAKKIVIDVTSTEHYTDSHDPVNTANNNGFVGNERFTLVPLGDHLVISQRELLSSVQP